VRHDALADQPCAIARSMAVLGERWTFVILRSAFTGARRFEDYQSSTGIARNILTDRLKTLVDHGILERRPYAEHPGRTLYEYRLTGKGLDLYPVLVSLMQWGNRYGGFDDGPPVELEHKTCGHMTTGRLVCAECGEELHAREVRAHPAGTVPAA
jgi:DNA-binding HxlR family transcriptional regulator